MVPQDVTEKILVQELRRKGGAVEYDTTFVSAVEQDGYVTAILDRRGERFEVAALFLVGCDGAHSAVRHLLNLPFAGAQYEASFMLADVDTNEVLPGDELQLCPSEFGPLAIFPMSTTRRRLVATIDNAEEGAPSHEFVRTVVAQRAPSGFQALSLRWSSYFRVHHRHVERNTGLQDVWNLAWKLDRAVRGHANEQMLDSYSAERCPVIKGVIETTHRLTRALGTASKLAQAVRNTVIPVVSRWGAFQKRFVQNLSELGISYAGSPIIEGSGNRFWDDSLRGGNGIKGRFLVLLGDDADPATKTAAGQFCESFADLVELRYVRRPGIILVRPDGYIAYEHAMSDDAAVFESVRSLLERQTS
jgi:2-polyprenyl-6-methoxyphenol hydroxylase-like FAD-dependent oxidoreductase